MDMITADRLREDEEANARLHTQPLTSGRCFIVATRRWHGPAWSEGRVQFERPLGRAPGLPCVELQTDEHPRIRRAISARHDLLKKNWGSCVDVDAVERAFQDYPHEVSVEVVRDIETLIAAVRADGIRLAIYKRLPDEHA